MTEQLVNLYETTLASGIDDATDTLVLSDLPPAGLTDPQWRLILDGEIAAKREFVLVTARTGTTCTVTRACEDATRYPAIAHDAGASVVHVLTAGAVANLEPKGHHTRHENGGDDEVSVAGLSGELADDQPPKAHDIIAKHTAATGSTGDVVTKQAGGGIAWQAPGGNATLATTNTSNPPTEAEAESAFAAPATWGRKLGHLDDAGAHLREYLALSDGTALWLALLARARGANATSATASNAAAPLTTPTYDGSGQAAHPSVCYVPTGWNGHTYWMAMTPYPGGNATGPPYENPSILCSDDGTTWSVPAGLTNPVVAAPGGGYNFDAELLIDLNGTAWLFYGQTNASTYDRIYVRSSTDGVTWSAATLILDLAFGDGLSPAPIWDGSQYVIWYVDSTANPNVLKRRTCATPDGTWSAATTCTVNSTLVGCDLWHLDVVKRGPEYHALFLYFTVAEYQLFFITSADGLTWDVPNTWLLKKSGAGGWDSFSMYRGCLVPTSTGYDCWYTGIQTSINGTWRVGRTPVTLDAVQTVANLSRLIAIRDTTDNIEALAGQLEELALAYATDTGRLGVYAGGAWHWFAGGAGTVTSVALSMPAEFSVANSPVTGAGTLAVTKATQAANRVYAGPTSGGAAAPAFRALVAADVPDLSAVYQPVGSGGSGGDHLHGLFRWAADGGTTVDLPDVAEYVECVTDDGVVLDPATLTLSADGTQLSFDVGPTAASVMVCQYVLMRV